MSIVSNAEVAGINSSDEISERIAESADVYLSNNLVTIFSAVSEFAKESKILNIVEGGISLGEPFFIYDVDDINQVKKYYYPIYSDGEIFSVLCLMGTTVGWQYSISTNLVPELNEVNYTNEECVFYEENGEVVAQTPNKRIDFAGAEDSAFSKKDFDEKAGIILDKIGQEKLISVGSSLSDSNTRIKYTPGIAETELGYFTLALKSAAGQYNFGMCWAAATATIVNYIKGSNLTAKNVCNMMKVGYDDGGTTEQCWESLNYYNVDYKYQKGQLSMTDLVNFVNLRKPIEMLLSAPSIPDPSTTSASQDRHAVTLYGYRKLGNGNFITIWDSNGNDGQGGRVMLTYNSRGTVLPYPKQDFTWDESIVWANSSYK